MLNFFTFKQDFGRLTTGVTGRHSSACKNEGR